MALMPNPSYAELVPCPRGCCATYREHVASIGIAASALPTRKAPIIHGNNKDANLAKDRDAYKRLRDQGLQPDRLHGARDIEAQAETKLEVERSTLLTPDQRKQIDVLKSEGVEV